VIELYAIADHPGPPLPDVAPLRAVAAGRLEVICAVATDVATSADVLWRHEEIVEAIMVDRDLLPFRFGTRVRDEGAAAAAIAASESDLAAALERVRGAVELSLRIIAPEPGDDDARDIHASLAVLARASMQRPPRAAGELLRAAYLVDRGDAAERFGRAVADCQAAHPELRLLCTGPWPPYSFAQP
jgi:Gas vesicle synthesis protein GvpL/GvpF